MLIGIETSTAELKMLGSTPAQLKCDIQALVLEHLRSKGLNPSKHAVQVSAQVLPSREEFAAAVRGGR